MIKNQRQLINNIFQIVYHQILLKLILKKNDLMILFIYKIQNN